MQQKETRSKMNCICCKNWGKCNCHREGNMAEIYTSDAAPHTLICGEEEPGFITPAQYKERTGREYPDKALVYFYNEDNKVTGGAFWAILREQISEFPRHCCAFGSLVPPDDWRPDLFQ